jgi:alkylhydroperoxidase/carboxymuconolactone decarboxylase family protein
MNLLLKKLKRLYVGIWSIYEQLIIYHVWRFDMSDYYNDEDLGRFGEIGKHKPELFRKFMDWYNSSLEPGLLTKREKVLIGLAVAHAVQCPYCIDAYSQSCLTEGMTLEHITEAVHVASAIKGGATLIHGIQAHNAADKISL